MTGINKIIGASPNLARACVKITPVVAFLLGTKLFPRDTARTSTLADPRDGATPRNKQRQADRKIESKKARKNG